MTKQIGLNNNHLKTSNRGAVLKLIANGQLSRTDIAARMGLSKMAISKIVGELLEEGYLTEKEVSPAGAVGRNPTLLDVAPSAPLAMGVYVSRNELCALLCDLTLKALYTRSVPLGNETRASFQKKLFGLCDDVMAKKRADRPDNALLGIGISSISPLDPVSGVILNPTNFYGITDYPVAKELRAKYGYPVFLDNDMNVSALAESLYGVGKEYDSFLYLGITNGIGSGTILNGRLFSNNSISVGEIGHTCINFDGPLCFCGNRGCLELYADMNVILGRLRKESGEAADPPDIARLSKRPGCARILRDVMEKLSVALINAVNLLDSQCVIIGHEGAYLPDEYLQFIEERVNRGILASQYKTVKVLRSSFFDRAPQLGSACIIFEKLFSGEQIG